MTEENRLFVGNLSWGTSDEDLKNAFEGGLDHKVVDAKVIMDRTTGRSRGFGFVTYATDQEAADAKEKMHNCEVDGRSIRVDKANSQQQRRPYGGGGGGGGGGYNRDNSGYGGRDNYRDNYQDNNQYQDNQQYNQDNQNY